MNDMRKLLSSAFPPPEDEPQPRDVVGPAMEWGDRRRRRDWTLTAAAAVMVLAIGAGAAALGTGSGSTSATGSDPLAPRTPRSFPLDGPGTAGTELCNIQNPPTSGGASDYCTAFNEAQNFDTAFAQGSAPYIQAALPPGFTVQGTGNHALILTGPGGRTTCSRRSPSPARSTGRHPRAARRRRAACRPARRAGASSCRAGRRAGRAPATSRTS
ncbi:hypothetical protein ACFQ9X_56035 [Catenulispora yoronensis]